MWLSVAFFKGWTKSQCPEEGELHKNEACKIYVVSPETTVQKILKEIIANLIRTGNWGEKKREAFIALQTKTYSNGIVCVFSQKLQHSESYLGFLVLVVLHHQQ